MHLSSLYRGVLQVDLALGYRDGQAGTGTWLVEAQCTGSPWSATRDARAGE
jgi:hypothetical protein